MLYNRWKTDQVKHSTSSPFPDVLHSRVPCAQKPQIVDSIVTIGRMARVSTALESTLSYLLFVHDIIGTVLDFKCDVTVVFQIYVIFVSAQYRCRKEYIKRKVIHKCRQIHF